MAYNPYMDRQRLQKIRQIVGEAFPETKQVKTLGSGDFSGYPKEVLKETLDVLDVIRETNGTLLGPLRIVYGAVEKAYKSDDTPDEANA